MHDYRNFFRRVAGWFGSPDWRTGAWATGIAAGVVIVFVALVSGVTSPRAKFHNAAQARQLDLIGYYENGWSTEFNDSYPTVKDHIGQLDAILAFWYSLDGGGKLISNQPRPDVEAWVKGQKKRFGVLINNKKGSAATNAGMLIDQSARTTAVTNVVNLVKTNRYDEVQIDFELLAPKYRDQLTAFIKQLRGALPKDVRLSMAVFPAVDVPKELNGVYDYAELAKSVDYMVLMAYDFHYEGGPPGPLSPNDWTAKNVAWMLSHGVPANKLVLAAGLYGIDWASNGSSSTERTTRGILAMAKDKGYTVTIDKASGNPVIRYTDDKGLKHEIWFQNDATLKERIDLAKKRGLKGVAIWRLGFDVPKDWDVIRAETGH